MCDSMREPPRPGTDLYMYWREDTEPYVGEERDLPVGDWTLRVRVTKVKESVYLPWPCKHVTMLVLGR